ncbi:competence protein ComFC [Mesobacillus persicus]|uniref:Competence protein ComFC n=1 Tax=Mesobacillus persicus TaxID=930146 RepID=A0A1H8A5R5_9BACI|nr:ComF family protein [Mesobacillus persicus]SEM65264.1 competence protein ComFC [Mesobacillus persicus]
MSLFADSYCLICHGVIDLAISWSSVLLATEDMVVCKSCHERLKPLSGERCRICGRVLSTDYRNRDQCFDCIRWEEDSEWGGLLAQNFCLYEYNEFLKEVIATFKYRGDYLLARAFKSGILRTLKNRKFDLIVPIPLSGERLYERGFNQSEALILEAGLQPTRLISRIHSEKQSKKSRSDRIHIPQVFRISEVEVVLLRDKTVLLIDDIYTTGSTLRHAAKVLHEHGVHQVFSFTIAR